MNVTVEDILNIKPGKAAAFRCESPGKVVSSRSLITYCNRVKRPIGVKRYSSAVNWNDLIVTITAVAEENNNSDMARKEQAL